MRNISRPYLAKYGSSSVKCWITKLLLCAFLFLSCVFAHAEEKDQITFSYWDEATPPFVFEQDGVVQGGIIKDLAQEITADLGVSAKFVRLPVGRIEDQLKQGLVDVDCLTSPIWKDSPGSYNWSLLLFESFDRFFVRAENRSQLKTYANLQGMILGIYNGYVYHSDIMKMIEAGEIETVKLHGVDHGIKLLQLGRIDVFIDFGILLNYQIKSKNLSPQLALADLPADQYSLHCAYSKKMTVNAEVMDAVINNIVKSGRLDKILKRYR